MLKILIIALAAFTALDTAAGEATTPHRLFHIERNKNANIVVYDALVQPDGMLPEEDPVEVYWLKLAEGGERKNLKGIERRMAYGFDIEEREGDRLVVKMVADIGRLIVVEEFAGIYKATIEMNGRTTFLEKVFIFAKETWPLPSVQYIELFGHDLETGEEAYEKYLP